MKGKSIVQLSELKRFFFGIMFSVAIGFSTIGCQSLDTIQSGLSGVMHRDQFKTGPDFLSLEIRRIAIIAQDDSGEVSDGGVRMVEDVFSGHLTGKGYTLAARSDTSAVEDEIGLQRTEMTDAEAAEIGKILQVDAVLVVSVTRFSTSRRRSEGRWLYSAEGTIAARLIDLNRDILASGVRSSGPISTSSTSCRGEAALQSIARGLARSFPDRPQ